MLVVLVLIALGALAVGAAAIAFGGHRRFNEVDRFHRASQMTTAWARDAVTKPVIQQPTPESSGSDGPARRRQRTEA